MTFYVKALSRAWSFSWISASSLAGSEPATIPAPAYRVALFLSMRAERMPTMNSLLFWVSIHPKGAAYKPLSKFSYCPICWQASSLVSPATAGVG